MRFPDSFMGKQAITKGMTLFGVSVDDLSREELLAVIGHMKELIDREREAGDRRATAAAMAARFVRGKA